LKWIAINNCDACEIIIKKMCKESLVYINDHGVVEARVNPENLIFNLGFKIHIIMNPLFFGHFLEDKIEKSNYQFSRPEIYAILYLESENVVGVSRSANM